MREPRDLGIKWSCWQTLIFSNEITIDMRYVCPKDVKKMLVQRAPSVFWKKWAAKHEYEELKEGAWLEPGQTLLRKKVKENWTEKHRKVARKIFLDGGLTQKRLFEIGWSDVSQCQACQMEEGAENHWLYHCSEWHAVKREIPEAFRKWWQEAKMSKKEWKWQEKALSRILPVKANGIEVPSA